MKTNWNMENIREGSRERAKLLFQLVVHDEHSELSTLCLALGFGELKELLLHVLLEFRDCVSDKAV